MLKIRVSVTILTLLLLSLPSYIEGTTYSEWIPVPAEKSTYISEIKEGRKFQIRTDKKIDRSNDIRWILAGVSFFWVTSTKIGAQYCVKDFSSEEQATMGFLQRAGDLTFLKTTTQLQIWFEGVLKVTWIYEDNREDRTCKMRSTMTGMIFKANNIEDKVSTHYRYAIDLQQCTGLDPAWNHLRTETAFPVDTGTELTVTCEDEFLLKGSDTVTCTEDTTFNSDTTPACVGLGEYHIGSVKSRAYVYNK
ncbi:hypothetical protein ACHWQZ_G012833 [Mnemiopsis leidyi]